MEASSLGQEGLRICSFEDEPEAIAGPLNSLEFEGHEISRCPDVPSVRDLLSKRDVDLVLVDEHISGDDGAGTKLIAELKAGELGPRNVNVPFGFITGSRRWVNEKVVSGYSGYLGIEIKGNSLTRTLEDWARIVRVGVDPSGLPELRRIPLFLEDIESVQDEPMNVILSIPAWAADKTVPYAVANLPISMQERLDQQVQSWFIARVSLYERDAAQMVIRDWELQEPLEDDDGLA